MNYAQSMVKLYIFWYKSAQLAQYHANTKHHKQLANKVPLRLLKKGVKVKKVLKWIGITVFGLIALGLIIDSTKSPEQKAAEAAQREQDSAQKAEAKKEQAKKEIAALPAVTANNIAVAYSENTVAADQKFKGKKFKVSGTVVNINTDLMGAPYITLQGGVNQFMEPQFGFEKSDAGQLANLKKGSKVTLVCIGKGDIAKTPMSGSCALL